MGTAAWEGKDLKEIGLKHGWKDGGPGGSHPYLMKKAGKRTVPIRSKLNNPNEVRSILKQMDIPRSAWPINLQ